MYNIPIDILYYKPIHNHVSWIQIVITEHYIALYEM